MEGGSAREVTDFIWARSYHNNHLAVEGLVMRLADISVDSANVKSMKGLMLRPLYGNQGDINEHADNQFSK